LGRVGVTASLSKTVLSVDPGGEVLIEVKIRNTGSVVDQFRCEVLGPAASMASLEPESLSLFPGAEGTVFVVLSVPRSATVASGEVPFAIRVTSSEDPEGSVVEEGVLTIGTFVDVFAELVPRTSRGRRSGRHQLALDNHGNSRVNAVLGATDPNGLLLFRFAPPALAGDPGTASFSTLVVRPRKTFLFGPPQTRPFEVLVEPQGQSPITVPGAMLQEARLPSWLPKAALGLVALALLGVILWFTVLKPTVRSAAKDAAKKEAAATNAKLAATDATASQAATKADQAAAKADQAAAGNAPGQGANQPGNATGTGGAPPGSGAAAIVTDLGNPSDHRLAVNAGATSEDSFVVEAKKVFSLTDVVMQNAAGDTGTLTILRGDQVLFADSLANFRNLDYHFVAPIVFDENAKLTMRVDCANAAPKNCTAATYLAGFIKNKPAPA